ncbi:MAG: IPT/TIG domain-containing protein [Candidatus Eremiobacteraeota bacterium]|nr:IPT/TIG domain-containing protein [Candidatus Eremiobacteraeota bacterium]
MKNTKSTLLPALVVILLLAGLVAGCGGDYNKGNNSYPYYGPTSSTSTTTPSPIVTGVTNSSGGATISPGNDCTVSGVGFGNTRSESVRASSSVRFVKTDGTYVEATAYKSWSNTSITCTVPTALQYGEQYTVVVIIVTATGDLSSNTTASAANTVVPSSSNPPQITSISPQTSAQGASLTITGVNFGSSQGSGYVRFQKGTDTPVSQSTVTSWSATQVVCIIPGTAPTGNISVYVRSNTGELSNAASLTIASSTSPIITSITPSTVTQGASTSITITGNNFESTQGSGYIAFQKGTDTAIQQTTTSSWSTTAVVCKVPSAVSSGVISVTVHTSGGVTSTAQNITVTSSSGPSITSISPSSISQGSATTLTINGVRFGSQKGSVSFQKGTETPITQSTTISWTSTKITCATPSDVYSNSGTYNVTVTSSQGESSGAATLTVGGSTSGKIYALFVGIDAYPDSPLNYCVSDINGLKSCLTSSSTWSGADITTLTDAAATKSGIQSAIATIVGKVGANDMFFMQYSGHGSNSGSNYYIVPVDGDSAATCISNTELDTWLTPLNSSSKKCMIFDSCHSGGFIGKGLPPGTRIRYKAIRGSDPNFKGPGFTKALQSLPNLVFLAACQGSELSLESSSLQHGVFTYYVMQGLGDGTTIGPAAAMGATTISAQDAFNYADPLVKAYVDDGSQNPQMQNNYSSGLTIK